MLSPSIQNIKERATCRAEIIHETNNTTHLTHRELSAFAHHNKNNASQNVMQQFLVTKSVDATKPTTAHMHVNHADHGILEAHSTLERSENEHPLTLHRTRHH
jgi:ATP sulfurylase